MLNDSLLKSLSIQQLTLLPNVGIGWYPVTAQPYDEAYFSKYKAYDDTPLGKDLTLARTALVKKYWIGSVVDIGVGGGKFVTDNDTYRGFDINPNAVSWLHASGLWENPYVTPVDAVTMWDSLEHIHDPKMLLDNVRRYVFCSLPIFDSLDGIMQSRHYRPTEHCWYFTDSGFRTFMRGMGFQVLETSWIETDLGRDSITSYALCRV